MQLADNNRAHSRNSQMVKIQCERCVQTDMATTTTAEHEHDDIPVTQKTFSLVENMPQIPAQTILSTVK